MHSIGSYQLIRYLNGGTFGGVWECRHAHTGLSYACKVVPFEQCYNQDFFTHFKNELYIHSQIRHPGIAQLKDVLMDADNIYVIIELCDGGDLNEAVQSTYGLDEDVAKQYFFEIMGAISYIHRLGIAHRDIKLENILVTSDGCAKLTDFGLCKQQTEGDLLLTTCGTLVYAAPEIIKAEPYDGMKADIWSAGILLYSMICNHFPWSIDPSTPPERIQNATAEQIVSGNIVYPDTMSFELLNLLQNMLTVDPEERPTADEVLEHPWLESAADDVDGLSTDPDPVLVGVVKSLINDLEKKISQSYIEHTM